LFFLADVAYSGINLDLYAMTFDPSFLTKLLRQEALAASLWWPQAKAAGTHVFAQGDVATHCWILESGLVKLSYVTVAGREWIKSFIADQGLFAGSSDLTDDEFNRYGAVCLEDSMMVALPVTWLAQRISSNSELQCALVAFMLWLQQRKQEREEALLCSSAEERYRAFLAEPSSLASRLQQNDIARYIGVTAIALSRIRKRQMVPMTMVNS
jgi:CRP/FNR family transcriptional regulator, anaerobic regulatory protein